MYEMERISRVYLVGIGGIGMSALARYFRKHQLDVAGFDSTQTELTTHLEKEGMAIHYTDSIDLIPKEFRTPDTETLVVYTPAVPDNHSELSFFRTNGFNVVKRSQALGILSGSRFTAAVAGTHGKTTTSTMLAHLLCHTQGGCDAFLGGISKNYGSNLILNDRGSNILVVEADEFDRSFLQLRPNIAIITSIDADHLDIFGTYEQVQEAFRDFVSNLKPNGVLIVKQGLEWVAAHRNDIKVYTYAVDLDANFRATDLKLTNGLSSFSLEIPSQTIEEISLGVLGVYNVENAVAASAVASILGANAEQIMSGLESFKGVNRRFDLRHWGRKSIYIDDYAHHPEELKAAIGSARRMFPNRKITGIFQPHLYSRTRDFAKEFAESLSILDYAIVTDIYPAREEPIEGVTPQLILDAVTSSQKGYCAFNGIETFVKENPIDILLTMGAGNIDKLAYSITETLKNKERQ